MGTRFWIKLYIEMLDDPKMARMPNHLWRRSVELFLLAGREGNDGTLPPVEEMAWILRLSEMKVLEDLQSLAEAGVVHMAEPGKWMVTGFAKRQSAVPMEERVRQYRERKGGNLVTNRYKRCNEGGGGESTSDSDSSYESGEETPSALAGTSPILKDKNGGGRTAVLAGEVTKPGSEMGEGILPRTPREAMENGDVRVFMEVTGGRIPGVSQYQAVIEAVRLVRGRRQLEEAGLRDFLRPFWLAWSSRKRKDGRPYDPGNITWLTEWALNGQIPVQGGSMISETRRPAAPSPEETRRMLAEKDEKLRQAVPMPEEVRAKIRGLTTQKAGKEEP
jgi:hypothetical protein